LSSIVRADIACLPIAPPILPAQGFRTKAFIVLSVLHGVTYCWTRHSRAIVFAHVILDALTVDRDVILPWWLL